MTKPIVLWAAVRACPEYDGKTEYLDWATLSPDIETAQSVAQRADKEHPWWTKDHPVVRVALVRLTELPQA